MYNLMIRNLNTGVIMDKQQQPNPAEQKPAKTKKAEGYNKKITGLDIDKAEYQEIVLSNSNFPDRDYFKRSYYD